MARKPLTITVTDPLPAMVNVMIRAGNMWMNDVKWFQYDVIEMAESDLTHIPEGSAKQTKDDPTVTKDADGNRVVL